MTGKYGEQWRESGLYEDAEEEYSEWLQGRDD
jgi:hypothetical protein